MATDFNLDSIVDFIFAAETDVEFVQRFCDSFKGKGYTTEQYVAVHRSVRNGERLVTRLCAALDNYNRATLAVVVGQRSV